ncbi:MAG: matrixin family metalloprotease [Acidobacteriota bacterium]
MSSSVRSDSFRRSLIVALAITLGLTAGSAFANFLGSGKFNSRFLNWQFYGTTSYNGSYTGPMQSAMNTWTNNTDVNFTRVYNGNWQIAQHVTNFGATGWNGLAYICGTNGACNNSSAWNSTYWYCIARENRYYHDSRNYTWRQAIGTHEAGHCLSLAHTNSTADVMYTWITNTARTSLSSHDRNDVNNRY